MQRDSLVAHVFGGGQQCRAVHELIADNVMIKTLYSNKKTEVRIYAGDDLTVEEKFDVSVLCFPLFSLCVVWIVCC